MSETKTLTSDVVEKLLPNGIIRIHRPIISDLNDATILGFQTSDLNVLNYPAGVTSNPSDYILYLGGASLGIQILIPLHARNIWIRNVIYGEWSEWKSANFT